MRYSRNPAVSIIETDGDGILSHAESNDIFYLDAVSNGLWLLLAESITRDENVAEFVDAFSNVSAHDIERDIDRALTDFVARDLVIADDDG